MFPYNPLAFVILALHVSSQAIEPSSIHISAPATAPSDVSPVVSHTFQSWACAVHSWPDYAGNHTSPNIFSRTLIRIIANKTGSAPHIRVGGTSGDRTTFVANQTAAIHYDEKPNTLIPENITIGPSFFQSFQTFPDAQYTWMVNLADNGTGHIENALAEARHGVASIGRNLESIEIGNEVDLYVAQRVRPANWTEADYVREWHAIASPLSATILEGNDYGINASWIYQALALSEAPPYAGDNFTVAGAFVEGIDSEKNIKSVSIHNYMTGQTTAARLQQAFMNHSAIVSNVSSWLPAKEYLAVNKPNVPLYLAEANSDSTVNTNAETYEIEGVFGDALWKVDILMYAMSQGIARYYVQQGTGYAFDSWQPVYINASAPQVLAPWYGDVFVADVVGTDSDVQVSNIPLTDTLTAYAVYISGVIAKYVIVNLEVWNSTTPYERPHEIIQLSVPSDVADAEVLQLQAPGAESMTGITWAGQSWNYSSSAADRVEVSGSLKSTTSKPHDGKVEVRLAASEALLVKLSK